MMNWVKIFLISIFAFCSCSRPKPDVYEVYTFAINQLISAYEFAGHPQPGLDRILIERISYEGKNDYNKLVNDPSYKNYKISFQDVSELKMRNRLEFTNNKFTSLIISDELFCNLNNQFIVYYKIEFIDHGYIGRLHIINNDRKFKLLKNEEIASYVE